MPLEPPVKIEGSLEQVSFDDYLGLKFADLSDHPLDDAQHERLQELLLAVDNVIHDPVFLDKDQQRALNPLVIKATLEDNPEAATATTQTIIDYLKSLK